MAPRDKTACQTFPCKCKICISSIESDVYNKKKIQMFVVNMTFISSREVKKCIFHSCLRHSWNIHFFTSLDEIKVIFSPNIWISSIYDNIEDTDNFVHLSCLISCIGWSSYLDFAKKGVPSLSSWKCRGVHCIILLTLVLLDWICPVFANSVDADKSASKKLTDLNLHCLSFSMWICSYNLD